MMESFTDRFTGRARSVRPGNKPAVEEEPAKKSNGKTTLVVLSLVFVAWLVGAGAGVVINRPAHASAGVSTPSSSTATPAAGTGTPAAGTTTPAPAATAHP